MKSISSPTIPTADQWESVRLRIQRIWSDMETIAHQLVENDVSDDDEVIARLEALQEKFEKVMGQLAAFDDEGQEVVRSAKEEFRKIVRKYQLSRKAGRLGLH